jgi:hypothetical protein
MPRCSRHGLTCCDGTPRSARIRRTVSHANPLSALSSTSISVPSQAPTRQASMSPNAIPIGVLTSRIGFAIRMLTSINPVRSYAPKTDPRCIVKRRRLKSSLTEPPQLSRRLEFQSRWIFGDSERSGGPPRRIHAGLAGQLVTRHARGAAWSAAVQVYRVDPHRSLTSAKRRRLTVTC